jgi:hypothetical protein
VGSIMAGHSFPCHYELVSAFLRISKVYNGLVMGGLLQLIEHEISER